MMGSQTAEKLITLLEQALKASLTELFQAKPDEHFYYITLTTSSTGMPPVISAWSWEALDAEVADLEGEERASEKDMLKWSYADSPYFDFGDAYNQHFSAVVELLQQHEAETCEVDVDLLLSCMEQALYHLVNNDFFTPYVDLNDCFINAEYMPPTPCNIDRAKRINPPSKALAIWLQEAAEFDDNHTEYT